MNRQANDQINFTVEERRWIEEHPVVRVSNYRNWPPIDFNDQGTPKGFSVDFVKLVAKKVGIALEFHSADQIPLMFDMVKNKELDLLHGIVQTAPRNEYLEFTNDYVEFPFYLFGRKDALPVKSIDDLASMRIGVLNGGASSNFLKNNYPHFTLVDQASTKEAFQSLVNNEIDVLGSILPIANYNILKYNVTGVKVIGANIFPELQGINLVRLAVRKDWPILRDILNKGINEVSDAEFMELSKKWQAEYRTKEDIGLSEEETLWLSENKVIRVAADPNIAPLEFIDQDGKVSGVAGSYLSEIEEILGVTFVWINNVDFITGLDKVKNGEADVLSAIAVTEERKEFLTFTDEYISLVNVIFSREGGELFGTMDGLSGHKVALIKGFSTTEFIKNDYPSIDAVEVENLTETLRLLAIGEVDAYVGDIMTGSFYIAESGTTQVMIAGDAPYSTELSMGIRNDLPLLASAMQKAMQAIPASRKSEIAQSWLSVNIDDRQNYDQLIKIVGVSILIIALTFFWIIILRRQIRKRKEIEKELWVARELAREANIEKSNFLANISHEIRTPLNAIIGFSEVMSSEIFGKIKVEKYKEYIDDIKSSGEHLVTVVSDLLDLTKIDAGNWTLDESEFDLVDCAKDTIKMLMPMAEKNGIRLVGNVDDIKFQYKIFADEHAIRRAFINLLSNSLKFTEYGGEVSLIISENYDQNIEIEITDTGIGIPQDKIEMVQTPFGQGHEVGDLNEMGTGLGLPIVKQLIMLHKGTFDLESEVGVGTTARITIPKSRRI